MNFNHQKQNIILLHPLAGSTFSNWLNLLTKNGGFSSQYLFRVLKIFLVSIYGIPFRVFERQKFARQIESIQIKNPPIFILGHWRSGTTHLHRLMNLDDNFICVSNFQTFLPEIFLGSAPFWKPIFEMTLPKTRPMDNVIYSFGVPEEEEYAIGNIHSANFYNCLYFPQRMKENFQESVLLDDAPEFQRKEWQTVYLKFLKKISFNEPEKTLLLKNPANTARIKTLLEIFPNAKFIHIYRNPYIVYTSTKSFYEKLLKNYTLQKINFKEVEENIYLFYQQLMQAFLSTKNLIPQENLIEISYESLVKNPISNIEYVYSTFNIANFEIVKKKLDLYLKSKSNYQKNDYDLDSETKKKIEEKWQFAIDNWKYNFSTCDAK